MDRTTTDDTTVNPDSSRTEIVSDVNGRGILRYRTQTTTSADGSTVTILRDTAGTGSFDQEEVDATAADGARSIATSDLAPNGTVINETLTQVSADGMTRTVSTDSTGAVNENGKPIFDAVETTGLSVSPSGTRTTTVVDFN